MDSHGDTLLPLFVIYGRHTTSSLHDLSDTRIPPDSRGTVVAAWRLTQQAFLTHREFICIGDSRPFLFIVNLLSWLFTWLLTWLHNPLVPHGSTWLFLTLGLATFLLLLWLVYRRGLRIFFHSLTHFMTDGVTVFFFISSKPEFFLLFNARGTFNGPLHSFVLLLVIRCTLTDPSLVLSSASATHADPFFKPFGIHLSQLARRCPNR